MMGMEARIGSRAKRTFEDHAGRHTHCRGDVVVDLVRRGVGECVINTQAFFWARALLSLWHARTTRMRSTRSERASGGRTPGTTCWRSGLVVEEEELCVKGRVCIGLSRLARTR